jgi:hypothetical protein
MNTEQSNRFYRFSIVSFFILACLTHLAVSAVGWNHTILDHHEFRQTQTALTVYYFLHEGLRLQYVTPVLGAPWSIPFELPVYQWIVAAFVLAFKLPLVQAGRLVSLLFFYISLAPLFLILRHLLKDRYTAMVLLAFCMINPIYLFWPRTFMIESTALCFSVFYLWFTLRAMDSSRAAFLICAMIAGTLAGMTKITTFVVFCIPALMAFVILWLKNNPAPLSRKVVARFFLIGCISTLAPLLVSLAWSGYTDGVRWDNPLAQGFLTGGEVRQWMLGTVDQRLSAGTWKRIFLDNLFSTRGVLYGILAMGILSIGINARYIGNRKYVHMAMLSMLAFMISLILFTNLCSVHDYYLYANSLFFSVSIGLLIVAGLGRDVSPRRRVPFIMMFSVVVGLMLFDYGSRYYPKQSINWDNTVRIARAVRDATGRDDVVLIYGMFWDPAIPFYSGRRAIMDGRDLPLEDRAMKRSLELTGRHRVRAMVVVGNKSERFIDERVDYFHLSGIPVYSGSYSINEKFYGPVRVFAGRKM